MDWIKTTDKLPKPHVDILMWNGEYHYIGQMNILDCGDIAWDAEDYRMYEDHVTHWMPLPEKPKF